jgi:hypothetical protein
LKNRAEPPTLQHTRSPLPSPPRPAGGGEEGDADHAGSPAAPRTRTDEELRLPPIRPAPRFGCRSPGHQGRLEGREERRGRCESEGSKRRGSYSEVWRPPPPHPAPARGARRRRRRALQSRSRRDLDYHSRAESPNYNAKGSTYT